VSTSRAIFRRRAIERRRDPSQDARSAEAAAALQARVAQQLAQSPLIQRLTAEAQAAASSSGSG
jgi:hypothetical protein